VRRNQGGQVLPPAYATCKQIVTHRLAERSVPKLHYGKQNPRFNPDAVNLTGTA